MLRTLFLAVAFLLAVAHCAEYIIHMPGSTKHQFKSLIQNTEIKFIRENHVPGWFLVEAPDHDDHAHLNALRSTEGIGIMSKQVELERRTRIVGLSASKSASIASYNDPWFRDSWYITGKTHFGYPSPITTNASLVWGEYNGHGVAVCVVDDGLATNHKDLKKNFDKNRSFSACGGTVDPPSSSYSHGTAAASVVGGECGNSVCGCGVAPGVTISAGRLLSCRVTDANEAATVAHKCDAPEGQRNDIFTMSWGPVDDGRHVEKPGVALQAAIEYCIQNGRGKRGSIYVVAGGNGARNRDSMPWDGYASSIFTIAVGAIANDGVAAWYSEWGSDMLTSVGSSGGSNGNYAGIAASSYNPFDDEICEWFGGTSAAAPQVAGIVALMLQARPDLTWRDVQHIIVHAGSIVDPNIVTQPWVTNAAGFAHSNQYGFGQLTAPNVERVAKTWTLVGPQKTFCTAPRDAHHTTIAPGTRESFILQIATQVSKLEHTVLHVNMDFDGALRDLGRIRLQSPSGTTNLLTGENVQTKTALDWDLVSVRFWGERPSGTWEILVENTGRSNIYLNSVSLCVYGE